MKYTRICLRNSFRGVNLKKEQWYCPSCMWHSYLTWYMSPPNIIKLSQTVWELWPAQDFGFRGDKYVKQELFFLHAPLLLDLIYVPTKYYQIFSNSVGVMRKILTRGDKYMTKKVRVVSLAPYTPTGPPLYLYQIWKQSTEEEKKHTTSKKG